MSSSISIKNVLVAAAALCVPLALGLPGCGSDASSKGASGGGAGKVDSGTGGSGNTAGLGGAGGSGNGTGVCLLNNCKSDAECDGCSFNRNKCDLASNRCIACDPAKPTEGCPAGQECSSFGTCVEVGKNCPTDGTGEPTIACTQNGDCDACDPMHRICDTTVGKCVACTDTNTSQCLQTDVCVDNKCAHKCPDSCTVDNDCGRCDSGGKPAHACFNHACAECSDTYACAAGMECKKGTCVKPCGLPGSTSGACKVDADCGGCGDQGSTSPAWKCKYPINGGTHGTCTPQAAGCSDLGQGAVLPEPYDKVTNLCSNDNDCKGIGIQYNVGEAIRGLIGGPELDVGIKKIKIQDANIQYNMPACADIKLTDTISCGVCVPCREDSDCSKIELDPLISDLFKGDPLATIAGAVLVDLLYGKNKDHSLHFQCLPVAAGYGVCIPCANPTKACGGTTSGGGGTCDHDVCTTGGPLDPSCGTCAAEVCKNDAFCCTTNWDSTCKSEVDDYCAGGCGGGGSSCGHDPCTTGTALSPLCSACVKAVCDGDAFCCNDTSGGWDSVCVSEAQQATECSGACSGGGCAHSECSTGGPLTNSCSSCATAVCAADSYCCTTDWDSLCVNEAKQQSACSCN